MLDFITIVSFSDELEKLSSFSAMGQRLKTIGTHIKAHTLPVIAEHTAKGGFIPDPMGYPSLPIGPAAKHIKSLIKKASVGPYQQETQWTCSAASLRAVLLHYGIDIPESHLGILVRVKKKGGAETTQIVDAAHKLGLEAFEKSFESLDEAKELLDADIPIICDIQSFNHPGSGHYVVLTGIEGDRVYLMDPNTPGNTRVLTRQEMEERWWDRAMKPPNDLMIKWGVVVLPPNETS